MNVIHRNRATVLKISALCILLVLITIGLTGCGKPRGMSDSNYQKCKQLIEVYDAYLDFKIDGETASEKIEKIAHTMDDNSTAIAMYYTEFWQTAGAMLKISDDPVSALEARNELAEGIGLPKR